MKIPERLLTTTRRLAAVLSLLLATTACGGPPTGEATGANVSRDPYAAVFEDLKDLSGKARTEKLVELAKQEGGLNIYTSNTDLADQSNEFTDKYGIEVEVYRAQANQVLQRLLQESKADQVGADLYDTNAKELAAANSEGMLREYEGPATDGLVEAARQTGWVGTRLNVFTVTWNTDKVQDPPKSLEDLTDERFKGITIMEPRAFEWYMTLSAYLTQEEGMSQGDVDRMISGMAANSALVEGHTEHANFLAAGEHGLSVNVYNHLVDELKDQGAPLSRTPAVEPVVVRPNGVGLMRAAQNPATALLFMEWLLTDAQQLFADEFRVPARKKYQKGELDDVETVAVDVEQLATEGAEWEKRFEKLLRGAGGRG